MLASPPPPHPPYGLGAHSPTARAASSKIPNTHSTALLALIHRSGAVSEGALILPQQLPFWSPCSRPCPQNSLSSTGHTGPPRGQIASLFCSILPMAPLRTWVPTRTRMTWPRDPSDHSPPTAPLLPTDEASGLFLKHGSTGLLLDFLFPLHGYSSDMFIQASAHIPGAVKLSPITVTTAHTLCSFTCY